MVDKENKVAPTIAWVSFNLGEMAAILLDVQSSIVKHTKEELTVEGFQEILNNHYSAQQTMDKIDGRLREIAQHLGTQI